jgi:squalene-associated FAD-dependent desaturase
MSPTRRALVVGGGLAGIAAALDCADAGAAVTLVEVRPRLGGAVYSFEREGLEIDNGQHVFLRCYENYRALLGRLGSERLTRIQARFEIPLLRPGSAPLRLRRADLPPPFHLAGALARYRLLKPSERLRAALAARALSRLDPEDPALDEMTFGDWLARHGQGPAAVAALWDLIALPALNVPAAQASLALAAYVFHTGLLARADAGDIGFHRATLSRVVGEPAERALREAGVEVKLGWRARELRIGRGGAGLEVGGPQALDADAVILAVPHARAAGLLDSLLPDEAAKLRLLESSPIVNLHMVYDRPVCDEPFLGGVGTPVQYLFDRTSEAGAPAGRQYLAMSLSGAEQDMKLSVAALRERYEPAMQALLPRAREARLERFLVTREHAATLRAVPGTAALRPSARTAVPGLALAGAWTATGGPATLEGAVISGHAAAAAALAHLGLGAARERSGAPRARSSAPPTPGQVSAPARGSAFASTTAGDAA